MSVTVYVKVASLDFVASLNVRMCIHLIHHPCRFDDRRASEFKSKLNASRVRNIYLIVRMMIVDAMHGWRGVG
jgi:hypothetical protein